MKIFGMVGFLICFALSSQQILDIGAREGEGILVQPYQVEEGPDGNIYVLDGHDSYIKVYSPKGEYMRRMAGKGEGPGEIKRAGGFTFSTDGKLLVFCEFFQGHRWLTAMQISGKLTRIIPLEYKKNFGLSRLTSIADGTFLAELHEMEIVERGPRFFFYKTPVALIRISPDGKILGEIIRKTTITRLSLIGDGGDVEVPFYPHFYWKLFGKDHVIFVDGIKNRGGLIDFQGKKTGEIPLEIPVAGKVTQNDLNRWRESYKEMLSKDRSWYQSFGRVIEEYKESIYPEKPNCSGISVTTEGNLLIENEIKESACEYWLLSMQGKKLLYFRKPVFGLKISPHFFFFQAPDKEGDSIWRFSPRKGKEVEQLKRVFMDRS